VEGLWSDVLDAYQHAAEAEAASGSESEVE
jgi:hypothetical protein